MGLLHTGIPALVLALLQLVPRFIPWLDEDRHRWVLSGTAGFGVGYVFIHLLPEIEQVGEVVEDEAGGLLPFTDYDGHVLALAGLIVFYGLQRLATIRADETETNARSPEIRVGVVLLTAFALYFTLVGYLLWYQPDETIGGLAIFTAAMALHFLGVNISLREQSHELHDRVGRRVLAVAVLLGWGLGAIGAVPSVALAAMLSLVAGGVVLIALKEELPAEHDGRWSAFVVGAAVATVLLSAA